MKEERILHLLGEVDEKYIAEAAPKETPKKKPVLRRLMIVAACLGLLLTLGCAAVAVTTVLSVNGFEVTATFAENHNAAAVHHVKQILISSFAGKTTKLQSRNILEIPDVQRYNDNGRRYYVP